MQWIWLVGCVLVAMGLLGVVGGWIETRLPGEPPIVDAAERKSRNGWWMISIGVPLSQVPAWWLVAAAVVSVYLIAGRVELQHEPRRRELPWLDYVVLWIAWPLVDVLSVPTNN